MPNHNAAPPTHEDDTLRSPFEIVQFPDGGMALAYSTPGEGETLGNRSRQKWARSFNGPNSSGMAIIKTERGNMYGIARGIVLNKNRRTARVLPPNPEIEVTVGEPCEIPGIATTTRVEGLYLCYKSVGPGSIMVDRQIDTPNPFKLLKTEVAKIINSER